MYIHGLIKILLSLLFIFVILIIAEVLLKKHKIRSEYSRKLVHISVATFVAFWPFYFSFQSVEILSVLLFIVIFISREAHIFKSIHNIKRRTVGDLLFPISFFTLALLTHNKYVFLASVLTMGLADGLAGLVGIIYIRKFKKKEQKTIIGSVTFFLVALVIFLLIKTLAPSGISTLNWPLVVMIPFATALIEHLSLFGADDITVPLITLLMLHF